MFGHFIPTKLLFRKESFIRELNDKSFEKRVENIVNDVMKDLISSSQKKE